MSIETYGRRLRGTLGTALFWGAGFATLAILLVGVFGILSVLGILPGGFSLMEAVIFAVRAGIVGGVVGVAFSTFMRVFFHGRKVSELSWVKFSIGGAIVTGLAVPTFLQTMNLLSGDGLVDWSLVLDDAAWTAVFGAVAGGGSVKLAQMDDRLQPGEEIDRLEGHGARIEGQGEDPPALGDGETEP